MLRLSDTDTLDRRALLCAAAGAVITGLFTLVDPGAAFGWRWLGPLGIAFAGAAPALLDRARAVAIAATGLLGYALWGRYETFADVAAGALLGLALALSARTTDAPQPDRPARLLPRAAVVALAAVAWPVALRAFASVEAWSATQHMLPPVVIHAAAGGLLGLLIGLTTVPLHLERRGDPVLEALHQARPVLDGELRDLVLRLVEARARALSLLARSKADAAARQETRRGLDGIALAAIELGDRFGAVERVLSRATPEALGERTAHLRQQHGRTEDAAVRRDLERALAELDEQARQLDRLRMGRARLLARLETELASLERAEISLAALASGDAAIIGLRLESLGAGLRRQAHELDAEGEALQEALDVSSQPALRRLAD